jgi:hypothetical protein
MNVRTYKTMALCSIAWVIGLFPAAAQQTIQILIPDLQITASKLETGDGDLYGLGDWRCTVSVRLESDTLVVDSYIIFKENANDFTTIKGKKQQRIVVPELAGCYGCGPLLSSSEGIVKGPNIGARGFRWFAGQGIIRRASIRTDTFGDDTGNIGGTLQFAPIQIDFDCGYAAISKTHLSPQIIRNRVVRH